MKVPECWVHGGANGSYPKNTISGFEFVLRDGAKGIETDVHVTIDQVVVLLHHPRLEKSGIKGKGLIKDHHYKGDLDQMWTTASPPQRIPTLEDAIELLTRPEYSHVMLNLDVKMDNKPELLLTLLDRTFTKTPQRKASIGKRVVLGLWHPKFIEPAKRILPYTRISHIGFSTAYARKHFWKHCESFSIHFAALVTPGGASFAADCAKEGKDLVVWTVNDRKQMILATKMGAQAVMTDETRKVIHWGREMETRWKDMELEVANYPSWIEWLYYLFVRLMFEIIGPFFIWWMSKE